MIAFTIYLLSTFACAYGLLLFLWWWKKTGKATTIYIYVTLLFAAELIAKTIHMITGYILVVQNNPNAFVDIILSHIWWIAELPSLIIFTLMLYAMTKRLHHTMTELRRIKEKRPPAKVKPERNVLVISKFKETRDFMQAAFTINDVTYYESADLLQGYELLVRDRYISVVMIGLSSIESCGFSAQRVIENIKKENPWCVVVALSRSPNLYELFASRRAYFDDYVYLPIDVDILLATYERWLARVSRWRKIEGIDRRVRSGMVWNRRTVVSRENPNNNPETNNKGE